MTSLLSPKAITHAIYAAIVDELKPVSGEKTAEVSIGDANVGKITITSIPAGRACRVAIGVKGTLIQGPNGFTRGQTWKDLAQLLSKEGYEVVSGDSLGGEGIEVVVVIPFA